MKQRPALAGSRNSTVLRSSPTQSDPSAAGDRAASGGNPKSEIRDRFGATPPRAGVPPTVAAPVCPPGCGSGKRRK